MSAALRALRETRLRDNAWVWTLGGDRIETSYGANAVAVAGRESVLVVDPLIAPAYARLVETAIAEKTSLPVRHVVLTHHHTDHALGASWFAARGAQIWAHPACRNAMAAEHPGLVHARREIPQLAELFRDAEPYIPSAIVDASIEIDLGGSRARVFHPGAGHTRGDLAVHLERESIVACGDLVSVGYHVNYEDAAVENLVDGLRTLRDLRASIYVPGHGPAGGPEILDAQARYHSVVGSAASASEIRDAFPEYALAELLPASVAVWQRK